MYHMSSVSCAKNGAIIWHCRTNNLRQQSREATVAGSQAGNIPPMGYGYEVSFVVVKGSQRKPYQLASSVEMNLPTCSSSEQQRSTGFLSHV